MRKNKPRIGLVFTGGTIEAIQNPINQIIDIKPESGGSELFNIYIKKNPIIQKNYDFVSKSPFSMFSENIIPSKWKEIAESIASHIDEGVDGVVVTHGTDIMPYTTSAISFMLSEIPIPVVFTGAFIPPYEKDSDAIQNLNDSILFAAKSEVAGVFAVFHSKEDNCGYMFKGNQLRSVPPYCENFYSANRNIASKFHLHPFRIICSKKYPEGYRLYDKIKVINKMDTRVDYFKIYPGFDPRHIEMAVDYGSKGIILELYHSGTACMAKDSKYSLAPYIEECAKRVPIFGLPWYESAGSNIYRTTYELREAGLNPLKMMSPECVLVKLMWLLGIHPNEINIIIKKMNENIAGEFLE